jgi:GT2 family glycosyltransferase
MKPGVIVTVHDYIAQFGVPCVDSLIAHTPTPREIFVFDNESSDPLWHALPRRYSGIGGVTVIRVDDQKSAGGLTGTWNRGVTTCLERGCDPIVLMNHDTKVNSSWINFLEAITDDTVIYGPMSNEPGALHVHGDQFSEDGPAGAGLRRVAIVNGFCFGFTAGLARANSFDGQNFFDPKLPFGGNETEFQRRYFRKCRGASASVVESAWVFHWKNHAWTRKGGPRYKPTTDVAVGSEPEPA